MQAFEISEEDVENVLFANWARIGNSGGKSFDLMASELFPGLNDGAIENAALAGGTDMEDQTTGAYAEIERQLVVAGILDPLAPMKAVAPARKMRP